MGQETRVETFKERATIAIRMMREYVAEKECAKAEGK